MLSKKLYLVIGEDKDLGNRLHRHYVYELDKQDQIEARKKMQKVAENITDKGLMSIAFDRKTKTLMRELLELKNDPHWESIVTRILKGLVCLLDREIEKARALPTPSNVEKYVTKELKKIHIYHSSDIIKIYLKKKGIYQVNYISRKHSPEYDGVLKYDGILTPWRDTQFIFTLNFNKNLFVWDYINVHKSFHGKKIGTKLACFVERLARDLGFTRFSVEYPNRRYWERKLGYEIPARYKIGPAGRMNYTHEGYKEAR